MRADIKLSTGLIVKHRLNISGATDAYTEMEMTEEEWQEYCAILKSQVVEADKEAKAIKQQAKSEMQKNFDLLKRYK